ncbi:ThuA domain-containing protein [Hydrocarboniphaga sp.]|uniref:ThuA domain-containing protein n=1 Tax=Hydrocarboniphaga sp. TaxID=2033016 RepID=UPI003D0DF71E
MESKSDGMDRYSVLVFSKTTGFRHDSIAQGIATIRELGDANGFSVVATEDAGVFTPQQLQQYRAVVFLSTTGDVLDAAQQQAFEGFIRGGGGFVGVHSATDTEYGWAWYGKLVGATFASHPAVQNAAIDVLDRGHVSTRMLPPHWSRRDEWYNFQMVPAPGVKILLQLDESSYQGGSMGTPHPIAWYQHYDGGRSWYTGLGHTVESYQEPLFRQHLLGGIQWAAGAPFAKTT